MCAPATDRELDRASTMADTTPGENVPDHASTSDCADKPDDFGKRELLRAAAGAGAMIGAGGACWVLLDSLAPARDAQSAPSVTVDLSTIPAGTGQVVTWRGMPIFVRHLSAQETQAARAASAPSSITPFTHRVKAGHEEWVVMIGLCTHLGCVPLGNAVNEPRGDFGGYFCPCHGSQYDAAGRVMQGPAPSDLKLPPYVFDGHDRLTIG